MKNKIEHVGLVVRMIASYPKVFIKIGSKVIFGITLNFNNYPEMRVSAIQGNSKNSLKKK